MNEQSLQLFKTLTEMRAAPGFESDIKQFVRGELLKATDEIVADRMGGVFGVVRGDEQGPKVMVAGHMDEVGFMVSSVTDNGMIRFVALGGWSNQVLLSMTVDIVTEQGVIPGVIGSTPPHLLSEDQRKSVMPIEHMYIDIGADDRDHALELGVRPGQQIVPVCPFTPLANRKKILAKAWDNRYGVGLAIELLHHVKKEELPNVLYSGATAQEELGLRGAETAAELIKPDICYVLDASPANDMSGDKNAFGQLGKGALLRIYDRSMLTHRGMVEFVRDTAETHHIPYQYYVSQGGTDAGRIHTSGIGVPTAVVGICARYIHTAASIIHIDDYAAAKELLIKLVKASDATMLNTLLR